MHKIGHPSNTNMISRNLPQNLVTDIKLMKKAENVEISTFLRVFLPMNCRTLGKLARWYIFRLTKVFVFIIYKKLRFL